MEDLESEADKLLESSLASNTWKTYNSAVEALAKFRLQYDLDNFWPVPLDHLLKFIAYLSYENFSSSTATTYISGISHFHKMRGVVDRTDSFLVVKMLEGFRRKGHNSQDLRAPITNEMLNRLVSALSKICSSNYEACLFSSAFTLLFFGLLRIGEIASENPSITGIHVICKQDIQFLTTNEGKQELHVKIRSSKSDQRGEAVVLQISEQSTHICPIRRLADFLKLRHPGYNRPLYLHFDGSNLTRYQFGVILRKALQFCDIRDHIRPHSFRIGRATELAKMNVADHDIKKMGRWSSNAYSGYIRLESSCEK